MHSLLLRMAILLISLNGFSIGKCQNPLDSIANYVLYSVRELEGNVFIDSTYEKLDTTQLKSRYPESVSRQIEFIRHYGLSIRDWSKEIFDYNLPWLRSQKEFFEENKKSIPIELAEDSVVFSKYENWQLNFQIRDSSADFLESSNRIMELKSQSSWDKRISTKLSRATPKLMRILSIYESEKYYLVIYYLMVLQGYPHYYLHSDLLFK
jgi:hypothetical protein